MAIILALETHDILVHFEIQILLDLDSRLFYLWHCTLSHVSLQTLINMAIEGCH